MSRLLSLVDNLINLLLNTPSLLIILLVVLIVWVIQDIRYQYPQSGNMMGAPAKTRAEFIPRLKAAEQTRQKGIRMRFFLAVEILGLLLTIVLLTRFIAGVG